MGKVWRRDGLIEEGWRGLPRQSHTLISTELSGKKKLIERKKKKGNKG